MRKLYHTVLTMLLALPFATAMAAPVGYSVNSDQPLGDTLHTVDLATGASSPVGVGVILLGPPALSDVEGLAIAPDLALWGVDEESMTLFQIDTEDGTVVLGSERSISGLDEPAKNDFGLTFTCDGTLYATSVASRSLYILDDEGTASRVGTKGSLGVNISALAAFGNDPVELYGLGNGLLGDEGPADNRSLYRVDMETATVTLVGEIGDAVADYDEAGLSFDAQGNLWAITDRSRAGQFSQILKLDKNSGQAAVQATTDVLGFESLAIGPPVGCEAAPPIGPYLGPGIQIPVLDEIGKVLAILVLMISGFVFLRRQPVRP